MATVTALLSLLLIAGASIGGLFVARSQALAAADAAALAAAVATHPDTGRQTPQVEARRAASSNGAALVSCDCALNPTLEVREVTVRVVIEVDASVFGVLRVPGASRAEFDPRAWLGR